MMHQHNIPPPLFFLTSVPSYRLGSSEDTGHTAKAVVAEEELEDSNLHLSQITAPGNGGGGVFFACQTFGERFEKLLLSLIGSHTNQALWGHLAMIITIFAYAIYGLTLSSSLKDVAR